jgi:hypothetical protein
LMALIGLFSWMMSAPIPSIVLLADFSDPVMPLLVCCAIALPQAHIATAAPAIMRPKPRRFDAIPIVPPLTVLLVTTADGIGGCPDWKYGAACSATPSRDFMSIGRILSLRAGLDVKSMARAAIVDRNLSLLLSH